MQVLPCLFVFQSPITLSLSYFLLRNLGNVSTIPCLNPIMLTCIPVKNCGYIVVSFQVVVSNKFLSHIPYIEHGFIGLLTHAAFGVLISSKYLCMPILSVQSLGLRGCY